MKRLKNKETGEVAEFIIHKRIEDSEDGNQVYALFDINPEEWEDAPEEPKSYWFINTACYEPIVHTYGEPYKMQIETGNHFETREECERAYEKLKAWKFGGEE